MSKPTNYFDLRTPCSNCPFRKHGAIHLMPGRLDGIKANLLADDLTGFNCHKTLDTGNERMCAGAAAWLMDQGRPTVGMRLAFTYRVISPQHWDKALTVIKRDSKQ